MALSLLGASTSAVTPKPPGPSTGRSRRGMKTETERSSAPDSTVSPASLVDSSPESHAAAVAAAAAAAFSGLTHPLLSSSHAAAILRASAAASQTAALMGLQSLGLPTSLTGGGGAATGVPVHLHATLASGPALFQHGSLFNWSKLAQHTAASNTPLPTRVTAARRQRKPPSNKRNNNNNKIKVESEVITQLDSSEPPLSPPTSGSSPPSTSGEPGSKAISSGGSSAGEPSKDGVGGRDKVFECRVCNRCFGYKHVLQNHERTHTGEKPFACPECNKRFTRDHHLKTHMRLHTGEKPYHCTHCERQFVQVANLRRHLRVHTGERPYACELCTSRFSDSNQLKAHMLIHKGEKPFACNLCGGRFRRRHHLMHHKCPEALRQQVTIRHDKVADLDELEEEEDELILDEEEMEVVAGDDGDVEDEDDITSFLGAPGKKRERKAREIRRVIRAPSTGVSPLPSPPDEPRSTCLLPEQTEPEDLSMSTMLNNNNTILVSSNGLARRLQRLRQGSFSSSDDEEELHRRGKLLVPTPVSPAAFLAHRHPKFRRHITADAAAPPIS